MYKTNGGVVRCLHLDMKLCTTSQIIVFLQMDMQLSASTLRDDNGRAFKHSTSGVNNVE